SNDTTAHGGLRPNACVKSFSICQACPPPRPLASYDPLETRLSRKTMQLCLTAFSLGDFSEQRLLTVRLLLGIVNIFPCRGLTICGLKNSNPMQKT
ncbi:MAG: hypothetical protein KBF48_08450, partial [Xanthomonadales bacterium]|nr:hypothetical protein [Xanthomonadales bacterium]